VIPFLITPELDWQIVTIGLIVDGMCVGFLSRVEGSNGSDDACLSVGSDGSIVDGLVGVQGSPVDNRCDSSSTISW
jgi:hypothetical protein